MSDQCGDGGPVENTDKHIWPIIQPVDSPSVAVYGVTHDAIGIEVSGTIITMPIARWHALPGVAAELAAALEQIADWPKNQFDGIDAARIARESLSRYHQLIGSSNVKA